MRTTGSRPQDAERATGKQFFCRAGICIGNCEWLVSYADFITLLFAFFVVLYASSQVDKRKVGRLALSIQVAFQQLGVFDSANRQIPLNISDGPPISAAAVSDSPDTSINVTQFVQPMKGFLVPSLPQPMKEVRQSVQKTLAAEIDRGVVAIQSRHDGLVISLREAGFYESGSAALRPSALDAVTRLASILSNRQELLRIEGHTDDIPIHNSSFSSNWELSTARASQFVEVLIDRFHFDPSRLSAAGYAEFRPAAPNDSPQNRALNRRVDIVVLHSRIASIPQSQP